ncbi:MAG: esterase [Hyphomicrobium sp. SCN 65-11]|nr:MAG: esterase [Hyphomicrobium sp. SCN 65-11]
MGRVGLLALLLCIGAGSAAQAAEVVALGASNTIGRGRGSTPDGVNPGQAFPAQLERLLQSQGCRVRVLNAGVAGNTTGQMLARMNGALGKDTRVLILQPGGNDQRSGRGNERAANIAEIRRRASARGIKVVMLDNLGRIAGGHRLPDGQHFGAGGHALFAAHLAPQVKAAGACR